MGCAQSSAVADMHEEEVIINATGRLSASRTSKKSGSMADFKFLGKLGAGAYATVHRARSAKLGDRTVAVKVVDLMGKESKEIDAKKRRCCELETEVLSLVQGKPNVISFYGSFIDGPLSCFVMELCDCSLLQAIERLPAITEASVCRMLKEMLTGISSVHKAGIVHRDIKPDNFLCVGPEATVKLCDFGLAGALPRGCPGLEGVFGTPPFMSPEMLTDRPHNQKTDAWSFGVIVYSLFYGRFPYEPPRMTGHLMKKAIKSGTPLPSFCPPDSLASAEPVSSGATLFARGLLNRDPRRRLSIDAALRHSFLASPGVADLAPMLKASKVTGAFCAVGHNDPAKKTEVDLRIEASQRDREVAQKALAKKASAEDLCSLPSTCDTNSRTSSLQSFDGPASMASATGSDSTPTPKNPISSV